TGGDIFINTLGGDDSILFAGAASTLGVSITVNGGDGVDTVQFQSDITVAAGNSLDVAADTISVNANATLSALGTGAVTFTAARNIVLATGSSISTVDGGITLSANDSGTAAGAISGIAVNGGEIVSSGSGAIRLSGKGGTAASGLAGVLLDGNG